MAKAKKTDSPKSKAAGTPSTSKAAASKAAPAQPLIDTAQAAQAAARMVANRTAVAGINTQATAQTSAFKMLKEGLNKPHLDSLNTMLDTTGDQKRSNQPFDLGAGKQIGHNQTFGADVNRHNIPRRTSGG